MKYLSREAVGCMNGLQMVEEHCVTGEAVPKGAVDVTQGRMLV